MIRLFLSYARGDGLAAATRLRGELTAMGFSMWRDLEELQGGLAWKEQLRAALRQVDAVLVLLTPGSMASKTVEWEWENALTLGKRVIGLLITPCDAPAELKRLHYHDLSDPATYTLGLAKLARDLVGLAVAQPSAAQPSTAAPKYQVGAAINSTAGDYGVTVNQFGPGGLDPAAIARLVQALRAQAPGDPAVQAEIVALLREMQPTLAGVAAGVRDLQAGQARIVARFDQQEQRIIAPILARLDAQQTAQTAAILDALDARAFPADELGRHLAAIHLALAEINVRSAHIADRQLAASVAQAAEIVSAPGLDVKHKLKLTVPIIPVLLSYEGEFELGSRLNLEEAWRAFQRWISGG
jgi:hypothetical protein